MNQEGFVRLFEYICGYIQLSIWPYPISLHQGAQHFGITVYIFAIIAFSGMLIFALKDRRRMFLFIWYFAFIAFPLTLAFVTQNDLKFYFADRYLYIPSVSIAILFSFLLQKLFNSRQKIMLLAIIPVFLILAVITVQASMDWQNNSTLFSTLVKKHPERMDNYRQVGEFYERHGQATKAIEEYKNALNNLHLNEDKAAIFNNMGRTYGMNGQPENAIYAFKMALLLQPLNSTALIGLGNNSSDYAQASYYYSKALETDRSNYTACNNLMRLNEVNGYQDKVEYYKQKCSSLQKGYSVNLELPLQK
jgi:tetratricopeptide (TPR) repeat protein